MKDVFKSYFEFTKGLISSPKDEILGTIIGYGIIAVALAVILIPFLFLGSFYLSFYLPPSFSNLFTWFYLSYPLTFIVLTYLFQGYLYHRKTHPKIKTSSEEILKLLRSEDEPTLIQGIKLISHARIDDQVKINILEKIIEKQPRSSKLSRMANSALLNTYTEMKEKKHHKLPNSVFLSSEMRIGRDLDNAEISLKIMEIGNFSNPKLFLNGSKNIVQHINPAQYVHHRTEETTEIDLSQITDIQAIYDLSQIPLGLEVLSDSTEKDEFIFVTKNITISNLDKFTPEDLQFVFFPSEDQEILSINTITGQSQFNKEGSVQINISKLETNFLTVNIQFKTKLKSMNQLNFLIEANCSELPKLSNYYLKLTENISSNLSIIKQETSGFVSEINYSNLKIYKKELEELKISWFTDGDNGIDLHTIKKELSPGENYTQSYPLSYTGNSIPSVSGDMTFLTEKFKINKLKLNWKSSC